MSFLRLAKAIEATLPIVTRTPPSRQATWEPPKTAAPEQLTIEQLLARLEAAGFPGVRIRPRDGI